MILSILLIFIFYQLYLYIKNYLKYIKFKGPFSLPIIGNLYDLEIFKNIKYLKKLNNKYGNIFKFSLFNDVFINITDHELVKIILTDKKNFYKGYAYTDRISYCFGEGLITSNGEKHSNDKKIFTKYFIPLNIIKHIKILDNIADNIINTYIDTKLCDNNIITLDIEKIFSLYTLKSILKYGFNMEYKDKFIEEKLCKIISNGSLLVGELMLFKYPLWNIIPSVKKLNEYKIFFKNEFKNILELYNTNNTNNIINDNFICAMLKNNLSIGEMEDHFITLLCAGQDTTSYFLSYMCYLLSDNQDIQDKLRKEIENYDTNLNIYDLLNNEYLNNVFYETLRLYSIVPNISRTCNNDIYFEKYNITIPKNSTIIIPIFLLNRNNEIWENSNKFNPERFKNRHDFFAFGYGNRICIGQYYSKIISCIILTKILKKFKIIKVNDFKPEILSGMSLTTKNGIYVSLEKI